MSHLLQGLQTYRRDCEAHYRRGKRDAYKTVAWMAGVVLFFAFYFWVGGAPQ